MADKLQLIPSKPIYLYDEPKMMPSGRRGEEVNWLKKDQLDALLREVERKALISEKGEDD